jgi:hypothetical protein
LHESVQRFAEFGRSLGRRFSFPTTDRVSIRDRQRPQIRPRAKATAYRSLCLVFAHSVATHRADDRRVAFPALAARHNRRLSFFRGFVMTRLSWLIGDAWLAAIVASLSFALGHVYQGWIGLLRTGLGGLAFSLAFVLTGSLLPSILAHTVLNLLSAPLFRPRDYLVPTRR